MRARTMRGCTCALITASLMAGGDAFAPPAHLRALRPQAHACGAQRLFMRSEQLDGDPFAILGVPTDVSPSALRAAYRRRARECHPDTSGHPDAAREFRRVVLSYEILSDARSRAIYEGWQAARTRSAGASYTWETRSPYRRAPRKEHFSRTQRVVSLATVCLYIAGQYLAWYLFLMGAAQLGR